jgi:hypothetical protein
VISNFSDLNQKDIVFSVGMTVKSTKTSSGFNIYGHKDEANPLKVSYPFENTIQFVVPLIYMIVLLLTFTFKNKTYPMLPVFSNFATMLMFSIYSQQFVSNIEYSGYELCGSFFLSAGLALLAFLVRLIIKKTRSNIMTILSGLAWIAFFIGFFLFNLTGMMYVLALQPIFQIVDFFFNKTSRVQMAQVILLSFLVWLVYVYTFGYKYNSSHYYIGSKVLIPVVFGFMGHAAQFVYLVAGPALLQPKK